MFVIPIIVTLLTQILKLAVDGIKGSLTIKNIFTDYGGMPSSHSAFVTSLVTLIALREGLSSPIFAVSLVFALVIIRDAFGFRYTMQKQSSLISDLLKKSNIDNRDHPLLRQRLGHKPVEVVVGILVGIILTLLLDYFL